MEFKEITAVVNGELSLDQLENGPLDFVRIDQRNFHILYNEKRFLAELVDHQPQNKRFVIKVNGSQYEVDLADRYDRIINTLGLHKYSTQQVGDVKAPMPGLVLEIQVEEGQTVEADQPLLILEAMKMENVLKAPGAGVVKSVKVEKGAAVDKNQVLIEMAEAEKT